MFLEPLIWAIFGMRVHCHLVSTWETNLHQNLDQVLDLPKCEVCLCSQNQDLNSLFLKPSLVELGNLGMQVHYHLVSA